jgi:hypothetical protein
VSNFPTSIPSLSNPSGQDYLNSPAHATQHANVNDEVTAVAAKIGTGASTPAAGKYLKGSAAGVSSWETLTLNRAFGFSIPGTLYVANDLSWNPVSPQAMTCSKTWAYCKTAPTGASLVLSIYNITQAAVVGTVTISAAATSGNSTSYTTSAIAAGDVLRIDITSVGSTIAGADVTVILETTQP